MSTNQHPSYMVADPDAVVPQDGDKPMTDRQCAELESLTRKLGEPMDGNLTRLQAAKRIAALREIAEDDG